MFATNRIVASLAVAGLALGGVACGDVDLVADDDAVTAASVDEVEVLGDGEIKGFIEVGDQETDGHIVSVVQAAVDGGGAWLVIHIDEGGEPGPVLGSVWLDEGVHYDVPVILGEELGGEVTLWAALYQDEAGGESGFDIQAETPITVDGVQLAIPFRAFLVRDVDGDPDVTYDGDDTVVYDNDTTVIYDEDPNGDDTTVVVQD